MKGGVGVKITHVTCDFVHHQRDEVLLDRQSESKKCIDAPNLKCEEVSVISFLLPDSSICSFYTSVLLRNQICSSPLDCRISCRALNSHTPVELNHLDAFYFLNNAVVRTHLCAARHSELHALTIVLRTQYTQFEHFLHISYQLCF
jgi:hypothetical protein